VIRLLPLLLLLTALGADEFRLVAPGITLAVPDGWTQAKASDGGSVVLRSPLPADADGPARSAQASIAISVEAAVPGRDSQALLDDTLATLRRLAPGFAMVDAPSTVTAGGRAWRRASYRFSTGELEWEQAVLAVADAQGAACITCSSDRAHFAAWAPAFAQALAGLEHKPSRLGR
jgi:hypothetical protein